MTSPSLIQDVSDTAFLAAAYRALESERSTPLFRDPLAVRLSGERGRQIIESLPQPAFMGGWSVIIRTGIIDRFIESLVAEGVDTVLNLGAGLDTRPYRMDLPASLRWIEVDVARVLDYKEKTLTGEIPRCRLERIRLDLGDADARNALLDKVASRSGNVAVLTEGVTPYLTQEAVQTLGYELRKLNSFHFWIADYFSPDAYRYRRRSGMAKALKHAPFLFEPDDYFDFFARTGWRPKEIRYLAEEGERLKRPPPFPPTQKIISGITKFFSPPERRQSMKRFAGFVLFKRGKL